MHSVRMTTKNKMNSKNHSTKILFTDLDGTLLDDTKNITDGNHAAIEKALSAGHKIVISTGRATAAAIPFAHKLGLDREGCYAICYNGGQIYDIYRNEAIYARTLEDTLAFEIYQKAVDRGLHIQSYTDEKFVVREENAETEYYASHCKMVYEVTKNPREALRQKQYKLLAISLTDHQALEDFRLELTEVYSKQINCFFSNDYYLEIVPVGISKGFAVQFMCEHLGIPIENSVAAGDAQNDVAMLEAAHIGAVMCNAFPGIEKFGNYITEHDNNHDGVAEIIEKFILA